MRTVRLVLIFALLLVSTAAAHAEEQPATRRIKIPAASLTVDVPADWTVDQYDDAPLKLSKGKAAVWFRTVAAAPGGSNDLQRLADRVGADLANPPKVARWKVKGAFGARALWYEEEGQTRFAGIINVTDKSAIHVEAYISEPEQDTRKALEAIFGTVNTTAFAHPERHVSWNDGWTLEIPSDWTRQRDEAHANRVRLRSPGRSGVTLRIDRVTEKAAAETAAQRVRRMIDATAETIRARGLSFSIEGEGGDMAIGSTDLKHGDAAPSFRGRARISREGMAQPIFMHVEALLVGRIELLLACTGGAKDVLEAARATAATLQEGTHPGPYEIRVPARPDRFESKKAPPVRFDLPEGWTLGTPRSPMRLAEIQAPGGLHGSVYYFGEGRGGGLEPNIERWKGQWTEAGEWKRETLELDDDMRATLLSGFGRYVAPLRPGLPDKHDKPDHGLLAAYVEVPKGPLMFKIVGPKKDVEKAATAFRNWIRSFKPAD